MMTRLAASVMLAGCLGASAPDPGPDAALTFHLTINVTSQMGETFSMTDGTIATHAMFTRGYVTADDRPAAVLLPVTLMGTKVVVPVDKCSAAGLMAEDVTYSSIGALDGVGVAGIYKWDCDFGNGPTPGGMQDLAITFDPNNPAPPL